MPDFSPEESVFVFVIHHSVADGIANILMLNDVTDNPTIDGYPNIIVRLTPLQRLQIYLAAPFYYFGGVAPKVDAMKPDRNCFKTEEMCKKLSEIKNVVILPDLSLDRVKKRTKEISSETGTHITINDYLMSILSKTVSDYDT